MRETPRSDMTALLELVLEAVLREMETEEMAAADPGRNAQRLGDDDERDDPTPPAAAGQ